MFVESDQASIFSQAGRVTRALRDKRRLLLVVLPTVSAPAFLLLLAAVGMVDGALLGLDLAYRHSVLENAKLSALISLDEEFGFAELWEYGLCIGASIAMCRSYRRNPEPVFGVLGLLFLWFALDNSFAIHERGGAFLAPLFSSIPSSRLHPGDYGELLAFGFIGSVALGSLFKGIRASSEWANAHAFAIIGCFALAAGFGVAVDFLHAALHNSSQLLEQALIFIEEGGELTMVSAAAALSLTLSFTAPAVGR